MRYRKVNGDLFNTRNRFALAHCIGRDLLLGAGIALQFRRKFPDMIKYLNEHKPDNYPSVIEWTGERHVYNLVTKDSSYGKPTREDFEAALYQLKELIVRDNVEALAIPLIGSYRDRLDWNITEQFILKLFSDTDLDIVVCIFPERYK